MNRKNFGAVIKRIEANRKLWDQFTGPNNAAYWNEMEGHCNTPYCFLGHALALQKGRLPKNGSKATGDVAASSSLAKWLGVSLEDMGRLYSPMNKLRDFKRWHKKGAVS